MRKNHALRRGGDSEDFLIWQQGGSSDPRNQTDLADWQTNYGTNGSLSAAWPTVPEPASRVLSLLGIGWIVFSRRRAGSGGCRFVI